MQDETSQPYEPDWIAHIQDFIADQFGYECWRWQVIAVLILLAAAVAGGTLLYIKDVRSHEPAVKLTAAPPPAKKAPPAAAYVYVCGAVVTPGVYQVRKGSRVVDAISLAGGFSADADSAAVNLAKTLSDGEQVIVPKIGQPTPAADPSGSPAGTASKVNVNTATAAQLDTLPGIGPTLADRIIAYRRQHGPFNSIDQVAEVEGIGPKKFAAIKPNIEI